MQFMQKALGGIAGVALASLAATSVMAEEFRLGLITVAVPIV
mgnify:CR=1 FL=1